MVNLSLNQVLMRSLNTSLVALLPILSLLFVGSFMLGATTLEEFALALLVGLFIGAYSSIFVAAPLARAAGRSASRGTRRCAEPAHGARCRGPVATGRAGSAARPADGAAPAARRRRRRRPVPPASAAPTGAAPAIRRATAAATRRNRRRGRRKRRPRR